MAVAASGSTDTGGAAMNHYERQTSTDGGTTWSALTLRLLDLGDRRGRDAGAVPGRRRRGQPLRLHPGDRAHRPQRPDRPDGHRRLAELESVAGHLRGQRGRARPTRRAAASPATSTARPRTAAPAGRRRPAARRSTISAEGETLVQFRAQGHPRAISRPGPRPRRSPATRCGSTAPRRTFRPLSGGSASWRTTSPWTVSAQLDRPERLRRRRVRVPDVAGQRHVVERDRRQLGRHLDQGTTYVQFRSIDNSGNVSAWSVLRPRSSSTRSAPSVPTLTGGSASWFTTSPQSVSASGVDATRRRVA